MINSISTNYTNQLLVSSLFGSSNNSINSINDATTKMLTSSTNANYSQTLQDYSQISQEAINAYQNEINKGTTYNPQIQTQMATYNSLINNNSSSSPTPGISANLILSAYQAQNQRFIK